MAGAWHDHDLRKQTLGRRYVIERRVLLIVSYSRAKGVGFWFTRCKKKTRPRSEAPALLIRAKGGVSQTYKIVLKEGNSPAPATMLFGVSLFQKKIVLSRVVIFLSRL